MVLVQRVALFCVSIGLLLGADVWGETIDVSVSSNVFTPSQITINVGDTVRWTNTGGGHNVSANDNSFRCANGCDDQGGNGAPSSANWVVTRTFNESGVIGYHCDPHQAIGMVGTITVEAMVEPEPEPGEIVLVRDPIPVDEGAGQVEVELRRQNGSDDVVTVTYSTSDATATAGSDYEAASGMVSWADGDSADKTIAVTITDDSETESNETFNFTISNPTGGATLGADTSSLVRIFDDDVEVTVCVPGPTTLCLNQDGRFKVEVTFDAGQGGGPMPGQTIDFGQRDSGLFWFFAESNAEVLIKVLEACFEPFNAYWVFYAATTDVQFDLVVTDTLAGQSKTYSNALNVPAQPVQDFTTFMTCP